MKYKKIYPLILVINIILITEVYCIVTDVKSYIFPRPTKVFISVIEVLKENPFDFFLTFSVSIIGFTLSIIFAFLCTYFMDRFKLIDQTLYPLFVAMQSVPTIILAPLFTIWFGYGILPKIIVIVLVCFFPIVVNLLQGFKSIDSDYIKLLKIYNASYNQIYYNVKFKGSLKSLFGGLKIAISYSFIAAVFAEMMGGKYGVGLVLMRYKSGYRIDKVFAVILIIMFTSFTLFKILESVEKRLDYNNEKNI